MTGIRVHPSVDPRLAKEPMTLARANQFVAEGLYDRAKELYDYLDTRYRPHAHARYMMAIVYRECGQREEALRWFREVVLLKPKWAEAWYNYALLLSEHGAWAEAERRIDRCLACDPDFASAWVTKGQMLAVRGQHQQARDAWAKAAAIPTDHIETRANLAIASFLLGDWATGWREYETRWGQPGFARVNGYRGPAAKNWQGEPLNGASITLFAEQGAGDSIMCLRYRSFVKAQGAGRIVWHLQNNLIRLVAITFPEDEVVRQGQDLPATEYICPLMSLPRHAGTTVDTVPLAGGYLTGGVADDDDDRRSVLGRQPEPQERPQPLAAHPYVRHAVHSRPPGAVRVAAAGAA